MKYIISSSNKKWHAEISACHGANITKLQYCCKDVFVPLESDKQITKNPYIHGSPILLPANRTYGGEFWFRGKKYTLPINEPNTNSHLHGLLHNQSFEIIEHNNDKAVFTYENKGNIYPFDFKITVSYLLNDKGLYQRYIIQNTGDCDMPFTFGLHTTFTEPEIFSVPISFRQERDNNFIPTGRYIKLNINESLYNTGYKSAGNTVSGCYKSCGNCAIIGDFCYKVSNNFDHWFLYNGGGDSGFLCIEPQCGAVNGLNIDNGYKILSPYEQIEFYTSIYVGNDL